MVYRALTGREYVFAVNGREKDTIRVLCEAELADPRSEQDPELLNDIAEMCLSRLRPGELGAVE